MLSDAYIEVAGEMACMCESVLYMKNMLYGRSMARAIKTGTQVDHDGTRTHNLRLIPRPIGGRRLIH